LLAKLKQSSSNPQSGLLVDNCAHMNLYRQVCGMRYSCAYRSLNTHSTNTEEKSVTGEETKGTDVHVLWRRLSTHQARSAVEILSIFLHKLASYVQPFNATDVYEEKRVHPQDFEDNGHRVDAVARHPNIEKLVDVLMEEAAALFGDREEARTLLIVAFICYDFNALTTTTKGEYVRADSQTFGHRRKQFPR
jgi:hypothetical protein